LSEIEREIIVPPGLEGGVFANHIEVFEDIEYATLDFAFVDPRDTGIGYVVARITVPRSGIIQLKQRVEQFR
jgi:hypothetical protein